ncbi:MAG TPA: SRPBCC family protein [Nocardioides sp.]|nr:SRPBCC family protein [Nocardioides sp.]
MSTTEASRSIRIAAPPERVWPWVAQIGQERGGFYSYTWLENLLGCEITNADRVHEEWQHPGVGDRVHLHPAVALEVAEVREGSRLVLEGTSPSYGFTWTFDVHSAPTGSELVVGERYRIRTRRARWTVRLLSVVSAVMTRRMLRGIRARVYSS